MLGDADQVALAMNAPARLFPRPTGTVSTGSNALVNVAQIIDVDTPGQDLCGRRPLFGRNSYPGRAGLRPTPQYGTQSPDQLVNEAVAFLTDDDLVPPIQVDDPTHMHTTHDCIPTDPMQ